MSVEKVTQTRYRCVCELRDCKGKGRPWLSENELIPERCRWCGRRTWNGTDLRKNSFIKANGKTMRLTEWAKQTGLSAQLIRARLKFGWTENDAVTIPAGGKRGE